MHVRAVLVHVGQDNVDGFGLHELFAHLLVVRHSVQRHRAVALDAAEVAEGWAGWRGAADAVTAAVVRQENDRVEDTSLHH